MQASQLQTLQDAVRQPLHIGVGLDHLLTPGQLAAYQIALPWEEEAEVSKPCPSATRAEMGVEWGLSSQDKRGAAGPGPWLTPAACLTGSSDRLGVKSTVTPVLKHIWDQSTVLKQPKFQI